MRKRVCLPSLGLVFMFLLMGCPGVGVVPAPPAPQNLSADRKWVKEGNDWVQKTFLKWDAVRNATPYNIYRRGEKEAKPVLIGSVQGTSYEDVVPKELWHSDIFYSVSAVAGKVEGSKAEEIKTEEPLTPPPF